MLNGIGCDSTVAWRVIAVAGIATTLLSACGSNHEPQSLTAVTIPAALESNSTTLEESETVEGWVESTESETCYFEPFAPRITTSCGDELPSGAATFDAPLGLGYDEVPADQVLSRGGELPSVPIPAFLSERPHYYTDGAPDGRLVAIADENERYGKWFAVLHYDSPSSSIDDAASHVADGRKVHRFKVGDVLGFGISQEYSFLDFRDLGLWDVTVVFDGERSAETMETFMQGFVAAAR